MQHIDWFHFTPAAAIAGGVLIGAAASLFVWGTGRVAGISGLLGSVLGRVFGRGPGAGRDGAAATIPALFLAGLLAAPWLWRAFASLPSAQPDVGPGVLVLAGLLVGVGVRLGKGCTSGHGVCGLARRSPRSLAHVLAFMAAGAAVVFVWRHGMMA